MNTVDFINDGLVMMYTDHFYKFLSVLTTCWEFTVGNSSDTKFCDQHEPLYFCCYGKCPNKPTDLQ